MGIVNPYLAQNSLARSEGRECFILAPSPGFAGRLHVHQYIGCIRPEPCVRNDNAQGAGSKPTDVAFKSLSRIPVLNPGPRSPTARVSAQHCLAVTVGVVRQLGAEQFNFWLAGQSERCFIFGRGLRRRRNTALRPSWRIQSCPIGSLLGYAASRNRTTFWRAGSVRTRSRCHREPSPHFCPRNNARSLCDDYSPAQENEIRNRLNPKLSSESRVFLGVDLED
jgi:hypothetical protein